MQSRMNIEEHFCTAVSLSSESPPSGPTPSYPLKPGMTGTHLGIAIICALIGLFFFPEIFDSAAIILGAYAWKREQGNRGLYVVIFGIVCMLIGLYFTAFILADLFP